MEYDKENVDSGPLFAYYSGTPCKSLIAATHQIMIRAEASPRREILPRRCITKLWIEVAQTSVTPRTKVCIARQVKETCSRVGGVFSNIQQRALHAVAFVSGI